jgi:tetratricopeptide (TPR) repeat protein
MESSREQLSRILDNLKYAADREAMGRLAEEGLQYLHPDDDPTIRASLHCILAASLVKPGRRFTPEVFARVLESYQVALTLYKPDQSPGIWAETQRNVGSTYLIALESGIGETHQYVEKAIAAYEKALQIPAEAHNSRVWLRCQLEMARALSIAAPWRGASALIASAAAYETALTVVTRDASPEEWALLTLKLAKSLEKVGTDEFFERAIRAGEGALQVLKAETRPLDWAGAHLLLGGLYRTRRSGNRDDNLEHAIYSLDNALSVFTRDATLDQWYRAHYHRGPAWLFRVRGDRDSNLIRALESLQIANNLTSRELAPEAWGGLQMSLGQAFLERQSGNLEANIECAITALEAALTVLPPDAGSESWKGASRMLAQAYLRRRRGDAAENVERVITVLTAVQEKLPEPDDPQAWAATLANLGMAWTRNPRGDPQRNRAKAIECFENAVRVPSDAWEKEDWSAFERKLALLYLDEKAVTLGKPYVFDRAAPAGDLSSGKEVTDPFDPEHQLGKQIEALQQAKDSGGEALELDPDWHVPGLLNEETQLLHQYLDEFLNTGFVSERSPEQRTHLESKRLFLFRSILEHLTEKYAARRTTKLFREVEGGRRPFVLFLRGFAMRELAYKGVTVSVGGGSQFAEWMEKHRLARKLSPVPLVWIANPADSGPLELQSVAMLQDTTAQPCPGPLETGFGFRVESGANWQSDVRALIAAATFIVIHNPEMTPGVVAEVEIVRELGRLGDTFFYCPEKIGTVFSDIGSDSSPLTEERIESIRDAAKGRVLQPGALPAATCAWIGGPRKQNIEAKVRAITRWVEQLAKSRTRLSTDLELDGYYYLLSSLVLLEAIDQIPSVLSGCAEALCSIGNESLHNATLLSAKYSKLASRLKSAWAQTAASSAIPERVAEALRIMEEDLPEVPSA